ncbi:MAG: hypothetical protein GXX99_04240 [Clostridiales bacterium]|nr:hypothetical protein [Clostridiales bacterium]
MASYRQPCVHCGEFIDRSARLCPRCGRRSPFGFFCPTCLHPVEKGSVVCAGCGRPLYTLCPACGAGTFVEEQCEACGASLMRPCPNPRCGQPQFFENQKCTACGKKLHTGRP